MPRYVVQRTFPEGLHIPVDNGGAVLCASVVEHSKTAARNQLPVDEITGVRVLDPYFYA